LSATVSDNRFVERARPRSIRRLVGRAQPPGFRRLIGRAQSPRVRRLATRAQLPEVRRLVARAPTPRVRCRIETMSVGVGHSAGGGRGAALTPGGRTIVARDFSPWKPCPPQPEPPGGRTSCAVNASSALQAEEIPGGANQGLKRLATIVRPPGEERGRARSATGLATAREERGRARITTGLATVGGRRMSGSNRRQRLRPGIGSELVRTLSLPSAPSLPSALTPLLPHCLPPSLPYSLPPFRGTMIP